MTAAPIPEDLVAEINLGSAGGRGRPRKRTAGAVQIIRALTADDLPALTEPSQLPVPLDGGIALTLRATHHALARCLAEGHPAERASLITGYSPGYIRQLQAVPAFAELLVHYQATKEAEFVDVAKRMRDLGLSSLDELQRRLDAAPDEWARGELMALAELLLVKGRAPATGAGGFAAPGASGPAVNINVKFVSPARAQPEGLAAPIIDVESTPSGGST